MKLSTSAAIILAAAGDSILKGAAARPIVSPLSGGSHLFPQANYDVEVDAAHENAVDGLGSLYGRHGLNRAYGKASISPALLSHIEQTLGTDIAAVLGEVSQVQTLRLTKTSSWHTDCEMDGPKKRTSSKKDQLQVGLFFSNTNKDAYFETKDGDLCIPVVEGNFVSFDGRAPHRSVVKSGHIDMVGPFSLSSDGFVNIAMMTLLLQSKVETMPPRQSFIDDGSLTRRQLSAENSSNIEGGLLMGDITDREEYPGDHFLKLNATGLPSNCTNDCGIAIALANSRECTKDVYDSAMKVLLPNELSYSTDEEGSTNGWFDQFFDNLEIENSPISLFEMLSMADAAVGLIDSLTNTHFAPVVYLYDKEKVPVACAYLQSVTHEEKEEFDTMFNGEENDADATEDEGSDAAAAVDVAGSGSVAVVPKFAVSMITACALALFSL